MGLAGEVSNGRRSGLTFAPEAGSWRLRQVINKLITEEDLYGAAESAFSQGWTRMKLYFLTGLPTETDDDTLGIAELAKNCAAIGRRHTKRASITVSLGGFVPKPHTPFQWFGQNTEAELRRKVNLVRTALHKARGVDAQVARPASNRRRGHRQPRRPPHRARDRARLARRAARSRSGASSSTSTAGRTRWTAEGLSLDWYVHRHRTDRRGAPVAAPDRRAARRLPVGRLAGGARRERGRGLPLDPLL